MKRFYTDVTVAEDGDGWRVLLDGRAVQTPSRAAQRLPTRALAEALAAEWAGQGDMIDPTAFPMRDMADFAIDVVAPDPSETVARLLAYAESDTLCYRADPDEPLYRRQQAVWEPLVTAAEARLGIAMTRVSGILHRPQPPETLARLSEAVAAPDPFALSALMTLTSLAASLLVGLAALEPGADIDALWNAANLEEDWQAEHWGRDEEALELRAKRAALFAQAARFAELASPK